MKHSNFFDPDGESFNCIDTILQVLLRLTSTSQSLMSKPRKLNEDERIFKIIIPQKTKRTSIFIYCKKTDSLFLAE